MLMMRISVHRGKPSNAESNIETPVTPPSMNLLDSRKAFRPKAAEKIPKMIRPIFTVSSTDRLIWLPPF
jgi:hypothetical protein